MDLIIYAMLKKYVQTSTAGKQDLLVSGENIKTINGASLLGSGNIDIVATETTFIVTDVILDD